MPVDASTVLPRVLALPIAEWSYTTTPRVRHMGPMGQDFHGAGATDKGIATTDADGVALAALQRIPHGKPAGVRCGQLTDDARCALFGRPGRPSAGLRPSHEMCGDTPVHAMAYLARLETATAP